MIDPRKEIANNLIKVANDIQAAPPEQFNMAFWFSKAGVSPFDAAEGEFLSYLVRGKVGHCGTSACIAGWICNTLLPPKEEVANYSIAVRACDLVGATNDTPVGRAFRSELLSMFGEVDWWIGRGYDELEEDDCDRSGLEDVTREMAVKELRLLALDVLKWEQGE